MHVHLHTEHFHLTYINIDPINLFKTNSAQMYMNQLKAYSVKRDTKFLTHVATYEHI